MLNKLRPLIVSRVQRAPNWVRDIIDHVALRADQLRARVSTMRGAAAETTPAIPTVDAQTRVLVAPANYAGQGYAWARAITRYVADAAAVNLATWRPGTYRFVTGCDVPTHVARLDRRWQRRESERVADTYTHLLVESVTPLFGNYLRGVDGERAFLQGRGVSVAYICHGTDVRSPQRHAASDDLSPFREPGANFTAAQQRVDRNVAALERSGAPVFVSTPDLLDDVPTAVWAPVVIDVDAWAPDTRDDTPHRTGPVVVMHLPSSQAVKGSHLIQDAVARVAATDLIRYVEVTQKPASEVREHMQSADIVLDQFRLGSYGVAACEAMAAGKVVVGHVSEKVRAHVKHATGYDLPIVQAVPSTLEAVLGELVADPARRAELSAASQAFVRAVHDGRMSAEAFADHWLRPASGDSA